MAQEVAQLAKFLQDTLAPQKVQHRPPPGLCAIRLPRQTTTRPAARRSFLLQEVIQAAEAQLKAASQHPGYSVLVLKVRARIVLCLSWPLHKGV